MNAWKPAVQEPDELHKAICNLARHLVFPDLVAPLATRHEDGLTTTLPDGRRAFVKMAFNLLADRYHGARAAIVYDLSGLATAGRDGYSFAGRVIVDAATSAFLAVECRCQPLGRVN